MKRPFAKSLWPDTLFTRMALLIAGLLILGQLALYAFFHTYEYGPRSQRLADQWAQMLILASAIAPTDYTRIQQHFFGKGIRLVSGSRLPTQGHGPERPFLRRVQSRLQARLGQQASILVDRSSHTLWLRWDGAHPVTLGLPMKQGSPVPLPYFKLMTLLLLSLLGGFLAVRQVSKPLSNLVNAVTGISEGRLPEPVNAQGPRDIRELANRFNQLLTDINALIRERELVLVGVSHDLRTPLTRIRLASEFLPSQENETRDEIIANVREMDAIIEQFIGYARDGQEEPVQVVQLDSMVADIIERYLTHEPSLDIKFSPGLGNLPLALQPVSMSRLVRNLVDNAIEHGAPPIEVGTHIVDQQMVLTVRDQGAGIKALELSDLPHAFVHGSASGGIGFGLAIVSRVARHHGGRLELINLPSGGVEAKVTIPLKHRPTSPRIN